MPTPTPAPAPNATTDTSLIGGIVSLIKIIWIENKPVALPLTVLVVITLVATTATVTLYRDKAALTSLVLIILVLVVLFVFFSWLLREHTANPQIASPQLAPGKPVRWVSRVFTGIAVALIVLLGIPQLMIVFPEIRPALQQAGFEKLLTPICILRPFTDCNKAFAEADARVAPQVTPVLTPPPAAAIDRSRFKVFVQFAGLQRPTVVALSTELHDRQWNVQGYAQGGERLPAAAGLTEVRYGPDADAAAARQIADEISAAQIAGKPLAIKQFSKIPAGTLEVWISG